MITTSTTANPNYLCKIVQLKGLKKHSNADRLQTVMIDFQNVITGMDAKDGDFYIYFPVESKINSNFLSFTNSFRDKTLNKNNEETGFFEDNCRVRAMKLRGERSQGYIVPITSVQEFLGYFDYENDQYFDTINNIKLVEKYIPKGTKQSGMANKQGKQPRETRLIENQFRLHVDTENLRRNIHKLKLTDDISVSYKLHGTSIVLSNLLVKKKLNWFEKLVKKLGLNIKDVEYDYIWSSRKVIKNSDLVDKENNSFYSDDIWGIVAQENNYKIPKGFSLYGEVVGYLPNGGAIQTMNGKVFDYGCKEGQHDFYVYRATFTNEDGVVIELSSKQLEWFCDKYDFKYPHSYFQGKYIDFIIQILGIQITENGLSDEEIILKMESLYNEKDCWMCSNKLPEEGIVLRVDKLDSFEAYKLKSFRFLEGESSQEEIDIETDN